MNRSFDTFLGILNGAIGDKLASENNSLAITMQCYHQGDPLDNHQPIHQQLDTPLSNKIVILLHGLTNIETIWQFTSNAENQDPQHIETSENQQHNDIQDDYGQRLQRDFGFTPFYLRYNSGLDIEQNGRALDTLITELIAHYPIAVDEILLIGFSMGGLIARCAQIHAQATDSSWLEKLTHGVYIGTPHEGAPLEKFADLSGSVFASFPQAYLNTWEHLFNARSEGIKSLKTGLLSTVASEESDSFAPHAQHSFIRGNVSKSSRALINTLVGDSLVRKPSAHPRSAPENSQFAHFDGIHHLALAHSAAVYQQLQDWLEPTSAAAELRYYQYTNADKMARLMQQQDGRQASLDSVSAKTTGDRDRAALQLALSAYQQALNTSEIMHDAIALEPYKILEKIPLTRSISGMVQACHNQVSSRVFGSLRAGGTAISTYVKH